MMISKFVNIKTKYNMQLKYYMELGYNINSDYFMVDVNHLTPNSKEIIEVKCDYCGKIENIKYIKYNRSMSSSIKKYACSRKCVGEKRTESNISIYGVSSISKLEKTKEITKKTNLLKYGVEFASQTNTTKEKIRETNLERYGVNCVLKSIEIRKQIKETNLLKYGVDNPTKLMLFIDKAKNTNLLKYGVEYPTQLEYFREKSKNTNLERRGVEFASQSIEFKENIKESNLLKYGVEHITQSDYFKEKSKLSLVRKYGVENISQFNSIIGNDDNYIKYLDNNISLFNCEKGHTFEINSDNYHSRIKYNIPLCTVCYPIGDQKSIKEKELLEYIKYIYSGEIISGYRDGLEIDIYLTELKLGFEFNGLYYHSSKFKENNYHLNKSEYFREKGIRIIHIWEDDYTNRLEIIKSQIQNLLGFSKSIFARKCIVKEVSIKESKQFLDDNHIQGCVSSQIKIGLYYNEELISLMTFNSFEGRKKMELGGYNLNRFCNKQGVNVVGGASKLLSYFKNNYEVNRIVSYADKDWSVGNLYEVLGFKNISNAKPDYKYIVNGHRVHKSRYRKSKLNTTLTESKQMEKDGFLKIYDCGKLKFELIL